MLIVTIFAANPSDGVNAQGDVSGIDVYKRQGMETAAVQIVAVTEVTILEEYFAAFPNILQIPFSLVIPWAVSYTHLDVYKRQA